MKSIKSVLAITALAALWPIAQASATAVTDPAGDFLPTYTGPHNGDMDVLNADVIFDGSQFVLAATLNGAIGTTPTGVYVWGFDRGGATIAPFGNIGNGNVIFNSVVLINANGTGSVTTLGVGGSTTALGAGSISISGNHFLATISSALLPSTGAGFADYLWNLWPRDGTAGNTAIPDFAPDNAMARVSVPEPATLALMACGLFGVGFARRRRGT